LTAYSFQATLRVLWLLDVHDSLDEDAEKIDLALTCMRFASIVLLQL
jgi:hypothetical protein